jgi:hypothetical protein
MPTVHVSRIKVASLRLRNDRDRISMPVRDKVGEVTLSGDES